MRLPRVTPFARSKREELLVLYRHFYPASGLLEQAGEAIPPPVVDRQYALSIVQLWMNRSACPYAVEATATLIQSTLLDEHMQTVAVAEHPLYPLEQMGGGAELGVRLNYTLAITRFVNSFVDAYQTGMFAQSIANIAARIGLPLWFVDIRHAGTHEELPSLEVCRAAAAAALDWLDSNFWAPSLFPPRLYQDAGQDADHDHDHDQEPGPSQDESDTEGAERAEALVALVKEYRRLGKAVARDHSLAGPLRPRVDKVLRQLVNWTLATSPVRMGRKRTRHEIEDEPEVSEPSSAALTELVNELIKPAGIIPLSKSKRATHGAVLSDQLEATWWPLLSYLQAQPQLGAEFTSLLADRLVVSLAATQGAGSYKLTAQAWLHRLAQTDADAPLLIASKCMLAPCAHTLSLIRLLAESTPKLSTQVTPLLSVFESFVESQIHPSTSTSTSTDNKIDPESALAEMQQRLDKALAATATATATAASSSATAPPSASHNDTRLLPPGWSPAGPTWSPTPIGCLAGQVPNLIL